VQGREGIRPVNGVVGALDLGGTHVSAARVDTATAAVEGLVRVPLPTAASGPQLLGGILGAATRIATPPVERVAVAVPGPFDYEAGICRISHKLQGLYGLDLRRELAGGLGLPRGAIVFLNDAHAFVLGEWWAGAARGHDRVVGVTLGTGLGSAFLDEGRPVTSGPKVPPGGEIYLLDFRGRPVEETISRAALLARYGGPAGADLDVDQVAARARQGDARAAAAFSDVASELGEFLEPLLRAFGPSSLVVGGSIAYAWDLLGPPLQNELVDAGELIVSRAERIEDAPLLGAARFAASGG
jgi:glucokinase